VLAVFSAVKIIGFVALSALLWLALSHAAPGMLGSLRPEGAQDLFSTGFEALFLLQMADFYVALYSVGPSGGLATTTAYSRALLGAAAAHDLRLTHAVAVPPSADAAAGGDAEPVAEQTLEPLAHPMRALALNGAVYALAALGGCGLLCLGAWMAIISLQVPPSFRHQPITLANWLAWLAFPCCLMALGVACAVWALITRRFAWMERASLSAQVDAEGVTFVRAGAAGRGRRLRWSDARSFARIAFTDELARVHECFVLSAAHEDYLWEALYVSATPLPAEAPGEEAWRVAAHRLAEQVVQRTGLRLLDLTQTIAATLATSPGASSNVAVWNVFARARVIARQQGDLAFARELSQRQVQAGGWLSRALMDLGARLGAGMRKLSPAQREETLRLARELLPYYPTTAQLTPDPRRRLLLRGYWSSEMFFQMLVIVLALANVLSFAFWPFS
jgi:hypothetical protein